MPPRPPSPEGRAESREARAGVGTAGQRHGSDLPSGRLASDLPSKLSRQMRKELTRQEAKLWVALRKLRPVGYHFRRQVPIVRYIADFACLKEGVIVEVDGGQHSEDRHAERDRSRDAGLSALGFRVLRFWNGEVDRDLVSVVDTILAALRPLEAVVASRPPADPTPLARRASRPSPPRRDRARLVLP